MTLDIQHDYGPPGDSPHAVQERCYLLVWKVMKQGGAHHQVEAIVGKREIQRVGGDPRTGRNAEMGKAPIQ